MDSEKLPENPNRENSRNRLKTLAIVICGCFIATLLALWVGYNFLFPNAFKPVTLTARETKVLEEKLQRFSNSSRSPALHRQHRGYNQSDEMHPEPYKEDAASRLIVLTEREVNALMAQNSDLGTRLAIDFSEDLASAKFLIPLDEEMPVLGGKTLKVSLGLELSYREEKPVVILKGVSIWGVPLPGAWVGDMKNIDLVKEFGDDQGFWSAFAAGIEEIEVTDGELRVLLKE